MGLKLQSEKYPQKTIVYLPDVTHTGMIHWYYDGDERAEKLATRIKNAKKKGQEDNCTATIGDGSITDIAAIVLAGFSVSEIGAMIAEGIGAVQAEVEAALNRFIPIIVPTPTLEQWKQRIEGGDVIV